jgi:hypothetical protein
MLLHNYIWKADDGKIKIISFIIQLSVSFSPASIFNKISKSEAEDDESVVSLISSSLAWGIWN